MLAGEEHEDDIFLNSLDWYADNGITLRAGVRADRIDRAAKLVYAADGTVDPVRPPDHRHRQPLVHPADGGRPRPTTASCCPGVFGFRTIDDTRAMLDAAAAMHARRS